MRQIVLDTETTGLSTKQGHRIIEIGCIEMVNRRLTGREYHRFLNPERDIDEGAEAVHGISRAQLESEPYFHEIAEEFLDFVVEQLITRDINPKNLAFEITETAAVDNLEKANVFIDRVRALGCQFALDDFGSGFSTFAYLKSLPIDYLKIDYKKVNPKGGAIAIGHPLGCTGARMFGTLLTELKRTNSKYGVISMCIGTGMGAAAVIERE